MGIRDLQTFMRLHYLASLNYEVLAGPVVIDGYGLMYELYGECNFDWRDGGRYPFYCDKVSRFLRRLVTAGITPIVVMDGLELDDMKFDTLFKRRQDSVITKEKIERSDTAKVRGFRYPTPPFLLQVFLEAVRQTECELIFPDGEADPIVMQTANDRLCPALANDSDFFIFPLSKGFILYHRESFTYNRTLKIFEAKIFRQVDFIKHKFADISLLYLIPAIIGNDFLDEADDIPVLPCFECPICERRPNNGASRIHALLKYIEDSRVRSLEEYERKHAGKMTCDNLIECKKIYSCERHRIAAAESIKQIPSWILRLHRSGKLSKHLTQALLNPHIVFINGAIDSPYEPSSSVLSSRKIRQAIYAIFRLEKVTEIYPNSGKLIAEEVYTDCQSPEGKTKEDTLLQRILHLDIPSCNLIQRSGLEEWFLVAASLNYWIKFKHRERVVVKALILSMIECYDRYFVHQDKMLDYNTLEWFPVLHIFSEWQSIYLDLITANTLLGTPLNALPPCMICNNHAAMLYSIQPQCAQQALERVLTDAKKYTLLMYLSSVSGLPTGAKNLTTKDLDVRKSLVLHKQTKYLHPHVHVHIPVGALVPRDARRKRHGEDSSMCNNEDIPDDCFDYTTAFYCPEETETDFYKDEISFYRDERELYDVEELRFKHFKTHKIKKESGKHYEKVEKLKWKKERRHDREIKERRILNTYIHNGCIMEDCDFELH